VLFDEVVDMLRRQGFTLIEIIVVLVIIGICVAFALPNFNIPTEQAKALNAQNNLLAIYSAQRNYNNNNGGFATALNGVAAINTALSLNIQDDGSYQYSCSAVSGFTCTATRTGNPAPLTLTVTNSPILLHQANSNTNNPLCTPAAGNNAWCP